MKPKSVLLDEIPDRVWRDLKHLAVEQGIPMRRLTARAILEFHARHKAIISAIPSVKFEAEQQLVQDQLEKEDKDIG